MNLDIKTELNENELLEINGGAIPALVILGLKVGAVIFGAGAIAGGCEAATRK